MLIGTITVRLLRFWFYRLGVLAYCLVKYPFTWSWKQMLSLCILMFLVGYFITAFGYILTQRHFSGNYANLEIV